MTQRFLSLLLLGLSGLICQTAAAADPPARPNLILINIDDLGYADIGPYGSTWHRTPNLDRMAKEGRRLTSHYAAPVCSPSRAALMTGCYPKRVLPIPGVLFPAGAVGLNPNERTVAEVLKDAGYATGCIGKWHLGDQPEFLPTRQGFDYYYGLPYSNDMGTIADGSKSNPGQPLPNPKAKAKGKSQEDDETGLKGFGQPPLPLVENERVIERVRVDGQTTIVKRYTEKAVQFIREHKQGPFFLYLPHTAVHFPHYPGMEFRGKSKNGLLGDWVEEMDWSIGQVLDTVR
ncbi:MAG: sulfatase-like hydrolase/transferase, partial [Planctomycetes bacterium]|nr:sulfatase-like hydrolase/transferase [Planctomycetota bacterium]